MALAMLLAAAVLVARPDTSRAVEFVVSTRFDAEPPIQGSFRDAILDANASPGPDVILFDMEPPSGSTIVTIDLVAALPAITDTVTIDATTQLGFNGQPVVEVRGPPQPVVPGLSFQGGSSGSRVQGLSLTGFQQAILLASGDNTVTRNWIGVGADTAVRANDTGIRVTGDRNQVGPANVVSGNTGTGVSIEGTPEDVSAGIPPDPAVGNTVVGNIVGLPPSGTGGGGLFGNREGVVLTGPAESNRVGGPAAADRNVISANSTGVAIGTDDTS
ncbi:MAG TPA: hypothetical protein VG795_03355, partial [Acidimicrobiia bacterium]|nr:hypothetical protein [Acidimicrobiia bacterium]